jgi:predicted adenylyl cyclase CyaB
MNDTLLSVKEAAEVLGVHWQTVRNYIEQGKIKSHRIGKLIRIQRSDINRFLHSEIPVQTKIKIEKRFLVDDRKALEKKLLELGVSVTSQARLIDHWFIPRLIKSREQHDDWFDSGRGCGVRIREVVSGFSDKRITTMETKRLTQSLNHNTFLESKVEVESYTNTKSVLEMMDLREFLTIDKSRVLYSRDNFKISLDEIKDYGTGVELEVSTFASREEALVEIDHLARLLGFEKNEELEKSMTVLAMDSLAVFH